MKNTKFLYILMTAIILSGCGEDFLDSLPLTKKTDETYYTTPDEAYESLVGCYDALQLIWSDGTALPLASDIMSDMCFAGTGVNDDDNWPMMDEFDKTLSPSNLNMFYGNWRDYYKGIYRCNVLIGKMDQIDWSKAEERRKNIEGEARFLRAFFYFDMVRMFERVPLLTEPTDGIVPQSGADETYKVIAEDLLFAIENCPSATYAQIAATDHGHATKWAAEALLARVFLYYTGYYNKTDLVGKVTKNEVLENLEDVIKNSEHGLVSNFANLWPAASTYEAAVNSKPISQNTYAGETNKEVVFAIKYTYTQNYNGNIDANVWMRMTGLRGKNVGKYGYGQGWGACPVPKEVYATWDDGDTRKHSSIMAIAEENIDFNNTDDKEYTGYYTKKYVAQCDSAGNSIAVKLGGPEWQFGQFQDYFSIRYSDVLLMAAELGSPNALDYVNQVHTRAGLDPLATIDKDLIFEERRLEFAFEGIRFWDLKRYDHTLAYAAEKIAYEGTVLSGGKEIPKKIDPDKFLQTKGLFQIPENEITLADGKLEQNEGWK